MFLHKTRQYQLALLCSRLLKMQQCACRASLYLTLTNKSSCPLDRTACMVYNKLMEVVFDELFDRDELSVLRELGIDPADLVFEYAPLPFMKSKQFVCRLELIDGLYSFDIPKKLPRKYKEQVARIEGRLVALNNTQMRRFMESAKKNAEFIERFNSELFFKHCFYKGTRISPAELSKFYQTSPYFHTINLSTPADRQPFIALYAMAFYGCTAEDIFSIDGIFSMQPERFADNAKKTAANSVFNLLLRDDRTEMEAAIVQMGSALIAIQPPRVVLSEMHILAKNYTMFAGLSEIGRVYADVAATFKGTSYPAVKSAAALAEYGRLTELCNLLTVIGLEEDHRKQGIYKRCKELFG